MPYEVQGGRGDGNRNKGAWGKAASPSNQKNKYFEKFTSEEITLAGDLLLLCRSSGQWEPSCDHVKHQATITDKIVYSMNLPDKPKYFGERQGPERCEDFGDMLERQNIKYSKTTKPVSITISSDTRSGKQVSFILDTPSLQAMLSNSRIEALFEKYIFVQSKRRRKGTYI